ncbi:hypothetical protein CANCADRAFT_20504, partial [Tortispora caseinolytica NRRL Y-17796]
DLSPEERARLVFGSPLSRRQTQLSAFEHHQGRLIRGVKVPAKPIEPDNCCMSGCINCVWNLFEEEVNDWNNARTLAVKKILRGGGSLKDWPTDFDPPVNIFQKVQKQLSGQKFSDEDLQIDPWKDLDVGMRVFLETEKRLRHKKT